MERAWQGLVSFVLFITATLNGVVSPSHQPPQPSTAVPRVDVFGDSVTWETQRWLIGDLEHRADVHLHLFGGTSICMWFPTMREVAQQRPDMVLVVFGLEYPSNCDHTSDPLRELRDDASAAAQIFAPAKVVFASDPPRYHSTSQAKIDAAYEAAARAHPNASVNYPGRAVSPDNTWTLLLPCLPDETAAMGCGREHAGMIKVRAPDGVHLCPVKPPPWQLCQVYSSGGRRFEAGVAAPVVAAYPWRPQVLTANTNNSPG